MASLNSSMVDSQLDNPLNVLLDLLGPDPGAPVCEAIRNDNEQKAQETSLDLKGLSTIGPKQEAINQGKIKFLKLLLERDRTISESLVFIACERKDIDAIRMLLDFGWDINAPIYSAASLLWFAVDDEEFMRQLIEIGADVNAKSNLDEPVLSIAIASGKIEVVYLLLAQGADITHGNLLHCAAERMDKSEGAELTMYLARKGADMNGYRYDNLVARQLRGMSRLPTPLHVACYKQNVPVARVLLENGADPQRQILEAGQLVPPTALESARASNNQELLSVFSIAKPEGEVNRNAPGSDYSGG